MGNLVCVTVDPGVSGVRPCVHLGEHHSGCEEAECRGCLPREARYGVVCARCWYALELAWAEWSLLEPYLTRYSRLSPRNESVGRAPAGPSIPLPQTALAADEVRSYLVGEPQDARAWVSTVDGARDAVGFTRAVQRAVRAHQIAERPRTLVRMRCPNPIHGTTPPLVVWEPPQYAGDTVSVKCEECGRTITDEEQWTAYRRTVDGWEGYQQQAIDVVAEIETRRKSVMTVMNEEETA